MTNIFQFKATSIDSKEIPIESYKGQIILVVNTASKCGFAPQYKGLQKIYEKYKDKNFVILAFPCNQFGGQEPGNNKEIKEFCSLNYGVTFPMFSRAEVNGKNAHPFFKYLKKKITRDYGRENKMELYKVSH
jgi:glutathione peroxidase